MDTTESIIKYFAGDVDLYKLARTPYTYSNRNKKWLPVRKVKRVIDIHIGYRKKFKQDYTDLLLLKKDLGILREYVTK